MHYRVWSIPILELEMESILNAFLRDYSNESLKTSAIEDETLNLDSVRSSIQKQFALPTFSEAPEPPYVFS